MERKLTVRVGDPFAEPDVPSVFFQFELPNHATWFVLSLFAAVALFYQFGRPLALRNFDLVGLFLFAPGLLLLDESRRLLLLGETGRGQRLQVIGYGTLLGACLFSYARCLYDLIAVKRARISPNLTLPSLLWLGGALLVGLAVGTQYRAEGRANEESQAAQANGTKEANGTSYGTSQDARKVTSVVMAVVCQVAVAVLLMLICRIHFQDTPAGAGSALLYLMLPSTAYHFELSIHVWPTALLLGAVLAYRRPAVAGGLLGLAAGTALFPVFLFPAWFQFYRDRGGLLFFRWFGLVGIVAFAGTFTILATLGNVTAGVWQTPNLADWQPWKVPTAQSVWTGAHWAYRLPIFVTFVGLVIGTLIWPAVRNLGQLIAVSAAIVIGLQFWLADGGGVYVSWFSPLLLLLAFRPTTLEIQPPNVNPDASWFLMFVRKLTRKSAPRPVAGPEAV